MNATSLTPELSIVIPIYNEEETLAELFARLFPALDAIGKTYEVIFVNDGSQDKSLNIMRDMFHKRPQQMRVIDLHYNVGQYMALMAGIDHVRGDITITLDADLQNPPEEIVKLVDKVMAGHDLVGSYRQDRQDTFFRKYASQFINGLRAKLTGLKMQDHGCMLRAYKRHIVNAMQRSEDPTIFINALAQKFAGNPIDIPVRHEARAAGESKYNLYKLMRLFFDLVTGFSLVPLQLFTFLGLVVSSGSFLLVIYMFLRRIFIGPEAEGIFTLLAILIFLVSVVITGIGLVGEYIGRIYMAAVRRPRYLVNELIEQLPSLDNKSST